MTQERFFIAVSKSTESQRADIARKIQSKGLPRTQNQKNQPQCHGILFWDPGTGHNLLVDTDSGYSDKDLDPREHKMLAKIREMASKMDLQPPEDLKPDYEIKYDLPGLCDFTVQYFGTPSDLDNYWERTLMNLQGTDAPKGTLVIENSHEGVVREFQVPVREADLHKPTTKATGVTR